MQMLLSDFPPAPPGAGLLLLRTVLAAFLVHKGVAGAGSAFDGTGAGIHAIVGLTLVLLGFAVGVGVFTPFVHAIVAVVQSVLAFISLQTPGFAVVADTPWQVPFFQAAIALAIALLGPGAYSIDCHLFGRQEIRIRRSDPEEG